MKAFQKASVCMENFQKGFGRDLYFWRIFRIYSTFSLQSLLKAPDNSSTWYSCLQCGMREGQAFFVSKLLLVIGHASAQLTNRLLHKGCHRYLGSAGCAQRALWTFIHAPGRKETRPNPWNKFPTQMVFLHWVHSVVAPLLDTVKASGNNKKLWLDIVLYLYKFWQLYQESAPDFYRRLFLAIHMGFSQVTHDTGSETPDI